MKILSFYILLNLLVFFNTKIIADSVKIEARCEATGRERVLPQQNSKAIHLPQQIIAAAFSSQDEDDQQIG